MELDNRLNLLLWKHPDVIESRSNAAGREEIGDFVVVGHFAHINGDLIGVAHGLASAFSIVYPIAHIVGARFIEGIIQFILEELHGNILKVGV